MLKQNLPKTIWSELIAIALLLSIPCGAAAESLDLKKETQKERTIAYDSVQAQFDSGPQEPACGCDLSRIYTKVCNGVLDCICDGTGDVVVSGAISCGEFKYTMYSGKSAYGEGWYGLCKDIIDYSETPPPAITIICVAP